MHSASPLSRVVLCLLLGSLAAFGQRTVVRPQTTSAGQPVPPPTPAPSGGALGNATLNVPPSTLASPLNAIVVKYPRSETKVHQQNKTELTVRWDKATVGQGSVVIELWRNGTLTHNFLAQGWGYPNDGEERVAWFTRFPAGGGYVIKVRTLDGKRSGISDPFTIIDEQSTEKLIYEPAWDQTLVTNIPNANPNPNTGWNPCQQFAGANQKKICVGIKGWNVEFSEGNYMGGTCRWEGIVRFGVKPGKIAANKVVKALLRFKGIDSDAYWSGPAPKWKLVVVKPGSLVDGTAIATNPSSPVDVTSIVKDWYSSQPDNGFAFVPVMEYGSKAQDFWRQVLGQFELEVEYLAE